MDALEAAGAELAPTGAVTTALACEAYIATAKASAGVFGNVKMRAPLLVDSYRQIQRRAEADARAIEVLRDENARLRAENARLRTRA